MHHCDKLIHFCSSTCCCCCLVIEHQTLYLSQTFHVVLLLQAFLRGFSGEKRDYYYYKLFLLERGMFFSCLLLLKLLQTPSKHVSKLSCDRDLVCCFMIQIFISFSVKQIIFTASGDRDGINVTGACYSFDLLTSVSLMTRKNYAYPEYCLIVLKIFFGI